MIELCGIKMYSPMELKEMTGFSKNKVYALLKSRKIEHVAFNKKMMITEQQIKEAIENLTVRRSTPRLYPKG